jgi:hypothetical protein
MPLWLQITIDVCLIVATLIGPVGPALATWLNKPKNTPDPNKSKQQTLINGIIRIFNLPYIFPPFIIATNLFTLYTLRHINPITTKLVLEISLSVALIFFALSFICIMILSQHLTETSELLIKAIFDVACTPSSLKKITQAPLKPTDEDQRPKIASEPN